MGSRRRWPGPDALEKAAWRRRGLGYVPAPMTRPTLSLLPEHRAELDDIYEDTFASFGKYFTLADAPDDDDTEAARTVASTLAGEVHSSDVDSDFYPCTLSGMDPSSDAFFAALGVARDARCKVSGWDNPKLEVVRAQAGEGEGSALALITRLNASELADVPNYLGPDGKEPIDAAIARLAALGPIVGIQLCTDDGVSKVVLTLARRPSGVHVGVMAIRIET